MNIIKADAMGMCFGVRDALQQAASIEHPENVTIHGQLVHNEQLLVQLEQRGFRMTDESRRDAIPETARVMVTAHGVSEKERARLKHAGKTLIDTTCPLVVRVHQAALELEAGGFHVLVIGKRDHVEVRGITGDLTRFDVVEAVGDVRRFDSTRLGIVCQSTVTSRDVTAIRQAVIKQNPQSEVRLIDTVCQPTKDRQTAIEKLARQVDTVVVVGGSNSNNTRRLAAYCRVQGLRTFHIQSAADLRADWFIGHESVGLTAGTSTLPETINEVYNRLTQIAESKKPPQDSMTKSSQPWQELPPSPQTAKQKAVLDTFTDDSRTHNKESAPC